MTRHGNIAESDIMQAAQFAMRMRALIQSEDKWAAIVDSAQKVLALAREPPMITPVTDVALVAVAFLSARSSARKLPPEDAKRIECELLIDRLVAQLG